MFGFLSSSRGEKRASTRGRTSQARIRARRPALEGLERRDLKAGDISEPIRTQRGYQLLKLEERSEAKVKTFEEARNEIGERIGNSKMQSAREKYLDKLRSEATIVWRNDELKKAYEQALAKRQGGTPAAQTAAR